MLARGISKRILIVAILVLSLLGVSFAGIAIAEKYKNAGAVTYYDEYYITDEEDFLNLVYQYNSADAYGYGSYGDTIYDDFGTTGYQLFCNSNAKIHLCCDIDWVKVQELYRDRDVYQHTGDLTFWPLGLERTKGNNGLILGESHVFSGVFYGYGHTIKNLEINFNPREAYWPEYTGGCTYGDLLGVGFFSSLMGTVQGLTLEDFTINIDNPGWYDKISSGGFYTIEQSADCGAIAGWAEKARIDNCVVKNFKVSYSESSAMSEGLKNGCGGIIGVEGGRHYNSSIEGSYGYWADGKVDVVNCYVENFEVTGASNYGAIIGYAWRDNTSIDECVLRNDAYMSATGEYTHVELSEEHYYTDKDTARSWVPCGLPEGAEHLQTPNWLVGWYVPPTDQFNDGWPLPYDPEISPERINFKYYIVDPTYDYRYEDIYTFNTIVVIPDTVELKSLLGRENETFYGVEPEGTYGWDGWEYLGWKVVEVDYGSDYVYKNYTHVVLNNVLKTYTITYKLNGGKMKEGEANPSTFTIADGVFLLKHPIKSGYDFEGWTIDLTDDSGDVTRVAAKEKWFFLGEVKLCGDLTVTAEWKERGYYTITYDLNGGSWGDQVGPDRYNEGDYLEIPNAEYGGFEFLGWTGSNGSVPERDLNIYSSDKEDKHFKANWEMDSYTYLIGYNLQGSGYEYFAEGEYTINDEIKITAPTLSGCKFVTWIYFSTVTGANASISFGDAYAQTTTFRGYGNVLIEAIYEYIDQQIVFQKDGDGDCVINVYSGTTTSNYTLIEADVTSHRATITPNWSITITTGNGVTTLTYRDSSDSKYYKIEYVYDVDSYRSAIRFRYSNGGSVNLSSTSYKVTSSGYFIITIDKKRYNIEFN